MRDPAAALPDARAVGSAGSDDPRPEPAVRAVVVTWNGADLLPHALDSLRDQRLTVSMEVVVVDNASSDATAQLLATRYPDVRVVTAERNLGFAGGAALGMEDFHGAVVVLLNNDARFEPDAVQHLVDALENDPRTGAVTATLLLDRPEEPVLVNSTGTQVTRWGAGVDRGWLAPRGTEPADPEVFGFCGGAAALRAEAVRAVGGFDASLFLYYEDTDLSWRLRAHGWTVRYESQAVAWHRHASSSGADSPLFRYYNTRNSLVVVGRHAPLQVAARSAARQTLGLAKALLREGLSAGVRARAHGLLAAARLTPQTLSQRRRLWTDARVPRREVWDVAAARDSAARTR